MTVPTVVDTGCPHTALAAPTQATTKAEPAKPHHAECLCSLCERLGSGYFAQREALVGELSAARHLSRPVFVFFAVERAKRQWARAVMKKAVRS